MIRTFALIFGVAFALGGIAGFFPQFLTPPSEHLDVGMNHGVLFGLFPINIPHNIIHLLFGLWGLAASRSIGGSRGYFQAVAVIYGLLAVLSQIPQTNTTFGFVPNYGYDLWLHLGLAVVAAYFGFIHRERASDVRRG